MSRAQRFLSILSVLMLSFSIISCSDSKTANPSIVKYPSIFKDLSKFKKVDSNNFIKLLRGGTYDDTRIFFMRGMSKKFNLVCRVGTVGSGPISSSTINCGGIVPNLKGIKTFDIDRGYDVTAKDNISTFKNRNFDEETALDYKEEFGNPKVLNKGEMFYVGINKDTLHKNDPNNVGIKMTCVRSETEFACKNERNHGFIVNGNHLGFF